MEDEDSPSCLQSNTSTLVDCLEWDDLNGTNLDISVTAELQELLRVVATGVFLGLIVLLTIIGNILVLVAVFVNSHLRSTTNYFIVNLAVADLLLGTAVLPFSASLEVLHRWTFGQAFCDVWAAVDVLCCTASILSLCVISVDRYIGVTRPLTYTSIMTEQRAFLLVLVVWAASVVISIGPLFGWKEPYDGNEDVCNVTSQLGYVLFSVAGSFYLPSLVILVVYYRIYRVVVKQTKFLEKGVKTTKTDSSSNNAAFEVTLRVHTGGGVGASSRSQSCDSLAVNIHSPNHHRITMSGAQGRLAKFKRQKKAAKTLGIVVGVFILCWFPFFFILPLRSLCSSCHIPDPLFQVFFWLGYCNSCLNPIIYVKSSREFKRAFKRILRCRLSNVPRPVVRDPPLWKQCESGLRTGRASVSSASSTHLHKSCTLSVPAAELFRRPEGERRKRLTSGSFHDFSSEAVLSPTPILETHEAADQLTRRILGKTDTNGDIMIPDSN